MLKSTFQASLLFAPPSRPPLYPREREQSIDTVNVNFMFFLPFSCFPLFFRIHFFPTFLFFIFCFSGKWYKMESLPFALKSGDFQLYTHFVYAYKYVWAKWRMNTHSPHI